MPLKRTSAFIWSKTTHLHTNAHKHTPGVSMIQPRCAPDVVFASKSPKECFHFKAQAVLQRHHGKQTRELKQLRVNQKIWKKQRNSCLCEMQIWAADERKNCSRVSTSYQEPSWSFAVPGFLHRYQCLGRVRVRKFAAF